MVNGAAGYQMRCDTLICRHISPYDPLDSACDRGWTKNLISVTQLKGVDFVRARETEMACLISMSAPEIPSFILPLSDPSGRGTAERALSGLLREVAAAEGRGAPLMLRAFLTGDRQDDAPVMRDLARREWIVVDERRLGTTAAAVLRVSDGGCRELGGSERDRLVEAAMAGDRSRFAPNFKGQFPRMRNGDVLVLAWAWARRRAAETGSTCVQRFCRRGLVRAWAIARLEPLSLKLRSLPADLQEKVRIILGKGEVSAVWNDLVRLFGVHMLTVPPLRQVLNRWRHKVLGRGRRDSRGASAARRAATSDGAQPVAGPAVPCGTTGSLIRDHATRPCRRETEQRLWQ